MINIIAWEYLGSLKVINLKYYTFFLFTLTYLSRTAIAFPGEHISEELKQENLEENGPAIVVGDHKIILSHEECFAEMIDVTYDDIDKILSYDCDTTEKIKYLKKIKKIV